MLKEKNMVHDHPLLADCRNVPEDMQQERLTKKLLTKINLDSFYSFGISSDIYMWTNV